MRSTALVMPSEPAPEWGAWVEVDLDVIANNIALLRRAVAPIDLLAVVKADGYGHGALAVAHTALRAGARWLGVARAHEGIALREGGVDAPILVLSEPPDGAAEACAEARLTVSLSRPEALQAFAAAGRILGRPVGVHLVVDTGMRREGCALADWEGLIRRAQELEGIEVDGMWSHLACADEPRRSVVTEGQIARFADAQEVAFGIGFRPRWRHLANSAGGLGWPHARGNLVRAGIAMYGLSPAQEAAGPPLPGLRPALALHGRVTGVRRVRAGQAVSYGHRWSAPRAGWVATVPVGYGDGLARGLSGKINVLVGGRSCPQVGTVAMDQVVVDLGEDPVSVGTEVVFLGDPSKGEPGVHDWAHALGTIDYEITCGLGRRLPRLYREDLSALACAPVEGEAHGASAQA